MSCFKGRVLQRVDQQSRVWPQVSGRTSTDTPPHTPSSGSRQRNRRSKAAEKIFSFTRYLIVTWHHQNRAPKETGKEQENKGPQRNKDKTRKKAEGKKMHMPMLQSGRSEDFEHTLKGNQLTLLFFKFAYSYIIFL